MKVIVVVMKRERWNIEKKVSVLEGVSFKMSSVDLKLWMKR